MGGTRKTYRNNCSFGFEGVEDQGCKAVTEGVLLGACRNDDWRLLVRCPSGFVSVAEDGKQQCRIEMAAHRS